MAFGGFDNRHKRTPMSEMNMVPLIDVMLVLLVIFIVTAPLLSHSVKIELPQASAKTIEAPAEKITFSIHADGTLYWNGEAIDRKTAQQQFAVASKKNPMPELHIHADRHSDYQFVAETLADASRAGLTTIGFVTKPQAEKNLSIQP
ncbi:biopolymer transporter ExbD [Oxalobacter vibrioformis]|uniref:Biopolymer transporter ExbD n=1 Tax=Oxalobacter vibrioformis TaxID=933080 RepID=A0A9E9P2Z0_9BURK|nr:biopolymer transporter ExbD [Oxalobacter vibrioformis]NLC23442.1 biopolymer transporter ExbD [Oxalobacter sp.]WAW10424.1 biopolymer transporter ExbD [Oxalobacter vibrioformis]